MGPELEDVDRLYAKDGDAVTHGLFAHKRTVHTVEVSGVQHEPITSS